MPSNTPETQALEPVTADVVNAKDEWLAFQSWWKRQRPGDPVPSPASLIFDAWMQSARHLQSHSLPGDVGAIAEIKAHVDRYNVNDDARRIYSTAQLETAIRLAIRVPSPCVDVGVLRELVHESLFHLRLDDAAKAYHDKATAALTPSALSPEHCQRCGHNNPSWSAPSPLWNAVIRGGSIDGDPTFDDMVCASCFTELAEQQGIASDWTVKAGKVNVPLETTTPSGRVWDDGKGLWVSALSGDAGEVETERLDPKDESPVTEGDAPNATPETPQVQP